MLRLVTIIVIATLLGCGRGGASKHGAIPAQPEGDWFCEMAENADDWECVQDPELARSPKPNRLPSQKPAPVLAAPLALTDDALIAEPETAAALLAAPPPPPEQPEPTTASATPEVADATSPAEVPAHIRLAYQPLEPTPILDMPASFYAVQLIAMTSRERLEAYIEDNHLEGMSAARIERGGELYYVLILGIYETRELAELASHDLPPPLDSTEAWIRELGDLQQAMLRGDAIAAGTPL